MKNIFFIFAFLLSIKAFAQPANDNCSTPTALGTLPTPGACAGGLQNGAVVSLAGQTNVGATNAGTGPAGAYQSVANCEGGTADPAAPALDVWYSFVASGNIVNINIAGFAGANFSVWTGACNNLQAIGCSVDGAIVLEQMNSGQTYLIQVSGGTPTATDASFTLNIDNDIDCNDCMRNSTLTVSPLPTGGTYAPGTTVNFCFHIDQWQQVSTNWLHGVQVSFGSGWDAASLTTNPPGPYGGTGSWSWQTSVTGSATGNVFGQGFYWDTSDPGTNPGNNFGDPIPLSNTTTVYNIPNNEWNFCFTLTVPVACNPGADLGVTINTSGDGESGSWADVGCQGDPPTTFVAFSACCPPTMAATPVLCNGGNTGTATATPVGTNSPYTYSWAPGGQTTQTATNLTAGTYTVTVVDASSCAQTATVTVTQPPTINATITPTNPNCTTTGSINVTGITGGVGPYDISVNNGSTYAFTNVASSGNVTGLAAGTYTVFIRDVNNCTRAFAVTNLTATGSVTSSFTPPAAQCLTGNNFSFTPTSTGSIVAGTTTYDWNLGGGTNPDPAATTSTAAQSTTYPSAGTYTVQLITTTGTCTNTFSATVTVNPMPAIPTANLTQPTCGLSNGAINITGPGTTYSFNGGAYSATTSYTNLAAGTYTVSVRNGTTCTTTTQFTLTNTPGPTAIASTTVTAHCGQSDGSITLGAVTGGTPVYTYSVTPVVGFSTATSYTGLASGTHTITVSDGNSCTFTTTVNVPNAAGPTAQAITPTAANCGTATGQVVFGATTGGSAPYTYSFNGGAYAATTTYTNLLPGTYNASVRDNFGCIFNTTVTVGSNPGPTNLVLTPAPANCGTSNGQITIGAVTGGAGGNTFSFNNGPFTATSPITNLAAGTYSVTVRDVNGCVFTQTTTITSSSGPTDVVLTTNPANCGASNGEVTIGAVTGGAGAMTFSFDGGAFSAATLYTGQTATTHTVIVRDGNGCEYTETVAVASNAGPTALAVTSTPSNCTPNNGTVTVGAVTGGTGPYFYDFNGSGFTGTTNYTGIAAGTYPVSVRDNNGCVFATTITVDPSLPPTAQATSTTNSTCGNPNGVVTIGATTGGTPAYTYSFNGGGFSATTSYTIAAGTYNVIVRDSKGCTFTTTSTVSNTPGPTAVALTPTNSTCGNNNGSISVGAVTGGTSGFQYSIDGGALGAGTSFTGLTATTHTILVQDANGCQFSQTVGVANTPGPTAQAVTPTNSTCGNANGSLNIGATTGGTGTITFQVDGVGGFTTTTNYTGLAAGTHTVDVRDANNCPLTVTVTINNTAGPTAVALSQTPANCGAANGVITVGAVTGGTSAFQYSINGGSTYQASTSFTGLLPATYTITVQDANNCLVTNTITVGNVGAPTVALTTQTNVSCNGGNNGTATFTASGGAGGFTYVLNTGTSNLTGIFTNLAQGTYTVTVTDAASCTATQTVSITQPTALSGSIIAQTDPLCNGGNNGSLTVGGLNGTPAYQYSLNGGAFQASGAFASLTSGSYTVTVRDNNGCTFPVPVVLNQPTAVSVVMSSANANCTAANGTATATPSGGTGAYTYTWTPSGGNSQTTIGVVAGSYTVTVRDVNNCPATGNVVVGVTPGGSATISSVTQVGCSGGSNGSITVSMSATAATSYTYTWTPSGGNSSTASGLVAGTYTVNITDNFGCTATANAGVTEPLPLTLTFASTNVSCNGGSDGTISATVNGGTIGYNYLWSPSVGAGATVSALPTGTYSLTVTDAQGCIITGNRTITEPTLLTITPVVANSHCNQSDGSISVTGAGGFAPYTFAINGGAFGPSGSFPNLAAGTYSITIKDNNNCTQTYPVTITDLAGPVATITSSTNVLCNGACDGTATVGVTGGVTPYTYAWQNGSVTTSATNLCAGIYTVTATDQNGCIASAGVTITEPTPLVANASGVDPKCNGGSNGTGIAGALGGTPGAGYSYSWTTIPAQLSANATGLSAGPYNVIVTDANGCTATASITLNNPPALTASIAVVNLSCFQVCTGSASATIGNATLPIQYNWTGGQTTQTASGLCAGSYTVSIVDANTCTATTSTTITEPTQLVASIPTSGNESCFNTNDAFAQGSASGGTPNYTYTWSNSFVGANNTGLDAGTYTLTVTDNNGCMDQEQVTLTAPPALALTVTETDITCNYAPPYPPICDGGAFASVTGGTGPFMYHWTPSQYTVNNPVTLCAGVHQVVVTDDNGCKDSTTIFINEPPEFTIELTADSSHCLFADGATNVVITGGATPHTIAWSNGVATPYNPGLVGGQYTISVTDAIGCQVLSSTVVNDIDGPSVSVMDSTMITCFGANDGTALASVFGGTLPYQSLGWVETSQPGLSASNLPGGFATIAVYDSAGCFGGDQVYIMEPTDVVTGIVSYQDVTCYNLFNGSAVVQANGGFYDPSDPSETNFYTISLYNPLQTQAGIAPNTSVNFAGLGVGPIGSTVTYTVQVTDVRGCKDSTTVTISQPQALVISNPIETDISCFGLSDGEISITATGGTPVYSYNWTSTVVGFVNPGTPVLNGLQAGSYTLSLVDSRGCTDNQIATIDEPTQVLLDSVVSTASCGLANGSAMVIATGGTPGYNYLWNNVPNSALATANSLSANLYHCDVIDANGCATGIDVVVPNAAGPTELNIASYAAKCFGGATGAVDVDATGGTAPLVYTWTTSGGTQLVSGPAPNDSVAGIMAGTYAVHVQDGNGCFFNSVINVAQPSPVILIASADETICYGSSAQISANVGGGTPPYSWTWAHNGTALPAISFPAVPPSFSLSNGPYFVSPPYTTPLNTYSVMVVDVNGCAPIVGQTIDITALPPIMMTAQTYTVCNNDLVALSANATGGNTSVGGTITYSWTPGGMTVPSPTVTAQDDPDNQQVFTVTASDGCSADTSVNHTIFINPTPTASLIGSNLSGCADLDVSFSGSGGSSFPNCIYEWSFGDNTQGFGSLITHTYTTNGLQNTSYDVQLTVTTPLGCVDVVTMPAYVTVYPNPIAAFTYNPLTTTEFDPLINFYDQSSLAATYAWNFGELTSLDNTSIIQNPTHNYAGPGLYDVNLMVTSVNGCIDDVTHQIYIEPEFAIYVPNAFSPNEDGKNESFFPQGIGIDEERFQMYIFDRWGEVIFQSNSLSKGWDGKVNGKPTPVQEDVYIWKIMAYDIKNNKHNLTGHVTVVR